MAKRSQKRVRRVRCKPPPADSGVRQASGQWAPGHSGNPAGPRRGYRHPKTVFFQALVDAEGESVIKKTMALASKGHPAALKIAMDRLVPPQRRRTLEIDLPPVTGPQDVPAALEAVTRAVTSGVLTPDEGASIATMVGQYRSALELVEIDTRLRALEACARIKR